MLQYMKIKDMPSIDQPREKLKRYGVERLTEAELLAILLGSGQNGDNAVQLASKVLKFMKEGRTDQISNDAIQAHLGVGKVKTSIIMAFYELARRLFKGKLTRLILSPSDVWSELHDIRDKRKEHFVVFYLDVRNQIIKRDVISIGTLNASLVHPREVFEPAIRDGAAQVIVSHNHPSDIVVPSEEDKKLTNRLISAGEILGIEVLDHIIVSKSTFLSFKKHGLI